MSLDYETAKYQSNFIFHLLSIQYIFRMNKRKNSCQTRVYLFFFLNLSNLQIYFVIPAKSLTQIGGNDFVLKNSHWPALAVSSSSRKCCSCLKFLFGFNSD